MKKKKQLRIFVYTYFCVLIPVLLISFLISETTLRSMLRKEDSSIENALQQSVRQTSLLVESFRENSVRISNFSELRPYQLLQSPENKIKGIEVLKRLSSYDTNIQDIALYYGTGMIYNAKGETISSVYFEKGLNCTQESLSAALDLLNDDRNQLMILRKSENDGFFLLHFSNSSKTAYDQPLSVNFLLSFSQMATQLREMIDSNISYISLALADGSTVHYACADNTLKVVSQEAYQNIQAAAKFTAIQRTVNNADMTLTVEYREDQLYAEVRRGQWINYLLIICGMLLSTLVAWIISYRRSRQISWLEAILQGNPVENQGFRGEFANLQTMIRHRVAETDDREKTLSESHLVLRCQTALMLFFGWVKDEETARRFLNACGMSRCEPYYFVGGILFAPGEEEAHLAQMEQLLAGDLCYRAELDGRAVIFFYAEAHTLDVAQGIRRGLAKRLGEILSEMEIYRVQIGLSSVRALLTEVNIAYAEAAQTIRRLMQSQEKEFCTCWDDVRAKSVLVPMLQPADVEPLRQAIAARDASRTEHIFACLMQQINASPSGTQEKAYMRSQLSMRISDAFCQDRPDEKDALNTVFAGIDPTDGSAFEAQMREALSNLLKSTGQKDSFAPIMQYISDHYMELNLSAEQVAQQAGITPQYLSFLFKSKTNMSYIDYVTQLRMKKACELLRSTDLPIQTIVEQVGYLDASNFRRKFKAMFGMGMHQYRNTNSKKQQ